MSVSVQTPYKKYTAAPGATVFPTTFRVVQATDLQVRVDTVVVTSGFTLSAMGLSAGLDVTFTAPMVGGEVVELQRIIPKSRVNDYQQLGNFDASVVNADIDRLWMSNQELGEEIARAVKVPIGSTIDPDQLIADLLATQAAAEAAAVETEADKLAAAASAAAAADSAASTNLPTSLVGKLLNFLRVKADESGYEALTPTQTRTALDLDHYSGRRKNLNGDFGINQLGLTSPVTLAAGAYGHDGFKAGAAGCTYSFVTVDNKTTLTITAGELLSVVDGLDLQSGTHVLYHEGTAQVKIDAGSYAAAPVTATLTGGTNATLAFGLGTLSLVQCEPGSKHTAYEYTSDEQKRCEKYCEIGTTFVSAVASTTLTNRSYNFPIRYRTLKRTGTPVITISATTTSRCTVTGVNTSNAGGFSMGLNNTNSDGDDFSYAFTFKSESRL